MWWHETKVEGHDLRIRQLKCYERVYEEGKWVKSPRLDQTTSATTQSNIILKKRIQEVPGTVVMYRLMTAEQRKKLVADLHRQKSYSEIDVKHPTVSGEIPVLPD